MNPNRRTIAKCDTFQGGQARSAATSEGDHRPGPVLRPGFHRVKVTEAPGECGGLIPRENARRFLVPLERGNAFGVPRRFRVGSLSVRRGLRFRETAERLQERCRGTGALRPNFWPAGGTERAPFAVTRIVLEWRATFRAAGLDEIICDATVRPVLGKKLRHENGVRPTSWHATEGTALYRLPVQEPTGSGTGPTIASTDSRTSSIVA